MIPKTIHYIWFGKNPKPEIVLKCIESWKKYLPDYKIIEWNEENYDVTKMNILLKHIKQKNGRLCRTMQDLIFYISKEEYILILTLKC